MITHKYNKVVLRVFSFLLPLSSLLVTSCADEFDRNFETVRPGSSEAYAYLNDYKALKEYVSDPNFHLGVGTDAADYAKQGVSYVVTNTNFNETVAGNAMKMASCVGDDGSMNFGTVEEYVKTAADAGMNVYGHTLAWHAQQPSKWLNSLLADKDDPDYVPGGTKIVEEEEQVNCIVVSSGDMEEAAWDTQFWILIPEDTPMHTGDAWEVSMKVRAEKACSAGTQTHKEPGGYIHWAAIGTVNFTTEWTEYKAKGSVEAASDGGWSIAFNLNDFAEANTYYFTDISYKLNGVEMVVNGDCKDLGNTTSFRTKERRGSTDPSTIVDKIIVKKEVSTGGGSQRVVETTVKRNCIQVVTADMAENPWDSQFWIVIPEESAMHAGDTWSVTMNVRADHDASIGTQTHKEPSAYIHWAGLGTVPFTTQWTEYKASGDVVAEQEGGWSIAFNLNDDATANTYYFDDISFKVNGVEMVKNGDCEDPNGTASFVSKEDRGDLVPSRIVDSYIEKTIIEAPEGKIPLTPEEKKEELTKAMEKWIAGMMEACKSDDGTVLVKAWDVVNEAVSGADSDGDGIYDLQHESDNKNDFFWQNYLGDEDYVRTAVRLARQYGGNDLKLFVNDYNLESDWDQNKKLKSLIEWIKIWESDGTTKIDGIGSQMHISCYADPNTQESKKNAIAESFKLMAATGKLVRISELDMGYVGTDGKAVKTADMTEEQHKQMAELYTWVIKQYLTTIPQAQQWGICQWCATDAPASSGWRGGEPVGLWDVNYYRKHTYAGFADGLGNK